jgi:type IV pilus assembly protein PilO
VAAAAEGPDLGRRVGRVIVVGWFLLLSTAHDELDAEHAKEPTLKNDYRAKLAQAVNLSELRKQKLQVEEYVTQLEKQLPGKAEMDALLSDINQAGLGRGLQFELFRPGQVAIKDYYAELPISLKVAGRYHDIGSFAADIANLSRIVTLHNVNITTPKDSTGVLAMEATARPIATSTPRARGHSPRGRPAKAKAGGSQAGAEASHDGRACIVSFDGVAARRRARPRACAGDEDELTQWMEQQKREVKPSVEPLSAPKKFNRSRTSRSARSSLSARKSSPSPSSRSAAAEFAPGGRDQPAQGAARGVSGGQHGHGRQRRPRRPPVCAVEGRQLAVSGQAGRLPRPELREDHSDLRNQCGLPRDRARRGGRMDRAQQRPPASGEGAMTSMWEKSMAAWRSRLLHSGVGGSRASRLVAGRDPGHHQLAAGRRRGDPRRAERGLAAVPAASPSRLRRGSRSTCPASPAPSASRWSRSTRATCAR